MSKFSHNEPLSTCNHSSPSKWREGMELDEGKGENGEQREVVKMGDKMRRVRNRLALKTLHTIGSLCQRRLTLFY